MADSHTSETATQRFARGSSASEQLRDVSFPLAVRGYDRRAVDEFVEQVRAVVAELESRQTREGIVQKALDELGEETAGILQRAHETADEIAARSRAKADGRLQRAEREAEIVRREADEYSERVVVDTQLLWEERQRLIEDIRQLADEVLATADDAMERVKMPEPLAGNEEDDPTAPEEGAAGPIGVLGGEGADAGPFDGAEEPLADEPEAPLDDPDPDATEPYQLGAVEDQPDSDQADPRPEDPEDTGHTVELEALPGGSDEDTAEHEQERD